MAENTLYYGDNLDILHRYIKEESVDLIYLDPPFNSNANYNVLFEDYEGSKSAAQLQAFKDTWSWAEAALTYEELTIQQGAMADALRAFGSLLHRGGMLAYLTMMAPRLQYLHRVLKPTGSIYLHCDPTASHYLKILMDAIFGTKNFKNEIIWHYRKWPSGKYTFQRNHDVILFYSRTDTNQHTFNQLFMERAASTLKRFGKAKITSGHDESGKRIPSKTDETDSEGVRQDDVWYISRVAPIKQLYPTQKPEALLERIITASSNEGDVILDPFCGCGTAIVAAQQLNRTWIGIDVAQASIQTIKKRLSDSFGTSAKYNVLGEPVSLHDAAKLAEEDPYQFQWWSLGLVGARPVEKKKGADQGIDGRLYFRLKEGEAPHQIILSVKAGHTGAAHVRDLYGVLDGQKADIGVLISMQEPTGPMKEAAGKGGYFQSPWGKHPRIQLISIADLLDGKKLDTPPLSQVNITFSKAAKAKEKGNEQTAFGFEDED